MLVCLLEIEVVKFQLLLLNFSASVALGWQKTQSTRSHMQIG